MSCFLANSHLPEWYRSCAHQVVTLERVFIPDLDRDKVFIIPVESQHFIPHRKLAAVIVDTGEFCLAPKFDFAVWVHAAKCLSVVREAGIDQVDYECGGHDYNLLLSPWQGGKS